MAGLGEVIRERREELGISQEELASRIETTRAYVSQIETGSKKWPRKYIAALSRELGIPESTLAKAAGRIRDRAPNHPAFDPELFVDLAVALAQLMHDAEYKRPEDVTAGLDAALRSHNPGADDQWIDENIDRLLRMAITVANHR